LGSFVKGDKMNILYIDPKMYVVGKMYPFYSGLFDELKKIANCYLYEGVCKNIAAAIKICPFNPDAIVFGLGFFAQHVFEEIEGLKELSIPVVCYMFKHHLDIQKKLYFFKVNKVSVILTPLPLYKSYEEQTGCSAKLFPYGTDPDVFKDRRLEKVYDFGFSGALHNSNLYVAGSFRSANLRLKIQNLIKQQKDLKCFLNGSDSIKPRISSREEYAKKINQSKIWLSTISPFGDIPGRYFEVGMSRTLIFTNPIPLEYHDILQDGVTCVQFSEDLSDFLDKLYYYLKNEDKRQEIVDNAYECFRANHTWKCRAEEILKIIRSLGNIL